MNFSSPLPLLALATIGLSACGVVPYVQGPNEVVATGHDTGIDQIGLKESDAAVVYDPDGCQAWIIDDGLEGYAGRRFDPVSGKPICDKKFPPDTVVGNYQSSSPGIADWVPSN